MNLFKVTDRLISRMKWYDISFIKLTVFFATLLLITVWPEFKNFVLSIEWHWYLVLSLLFMAPILKKMFE